jgi:NDP-sugar pyrophosphorylase family protein
MDGRYPISVIIPSARSDEIMIKDFFDEAHINQLPLANATLAQYLLNDLCRLRSSIDAHLVVDRIHMIIDRDQERSYRRLLGDSGKDIEYHVQKEFGVRGLFDALDEVVLPRASNIAKAKEPFLVIYGDTLIQDDFLKAIMKVAAENISRGGSDEWIVAGLVQRQDIRGSHMSAYMDQSFDLSKNRWGHYVIDRRKIEKISPGLHKISPSGIMDITTPAYPELYSRKAPCFVIETGCYVFSFGAWQELRKHKNIDAQGLYSITNAIRRARMQGARIKITGVISDKSTDWIDINYPWEYLKTSDYLTNRILRLQPFYAAEEQNHPYVVGSNLRVASNMDQLCKWFPWEHKPRAARSSARLKKQIRYSYHNEYDQIYSWGVHKDALVEFPVFVPADSKRGKILIEPNANVSAYCVLKSNCRIRANAIVKSSIICEHVFIDHYSYIDHSIIMSGTKIFPNCMVPYSIIGKNVVVGGSVAIACERLDWSEKYRHVLRRMIAERPSIASKRGKSRHDGYDNYEFWLEGEVDIDVKPRVAFGEFYSDTQMIRYRDRFSAIIGNDVEIGMNVFIEPGRKIGRGSVVCPGVEVKKNVPRDSVIYLKEV